MVVAIQKEWMVEGSGCITLKDKECCKDVDSVLLKSKQAKKLCQY